MEQHYHTVLTIAGSDSSGGAGVQADIKSICANGGYAASVVSVLLKGGHLPLDEVMTDILYHYRTKEIISIKNPMIKTNNLHGTGCTLSSAIATYLARGEGLEEAVMKGCRYLNQAIETGKERKLGKGAGPVNHFFVLE